jgi:hypothetical protein
LFHLFHVRRRPAHRLPIALSLALAGLLRATTKECN